MRSQCQRRQKISAIIEELGRVAGSVSGVRLLDVDPGAETNRTVFTFVGAPLAVAEAAFMLTARAQKQIDMRTHHGAHARIGAVDVCPVRAGRRREHGKSVSRWPAPWASASARKLGIPVYLYEAAAEPSFAQEPRRGAQRRIRRLRLAKLAGARPEWSPDFGPREFGEKQQRSGASVIGARPFLIAYNLNLNTRDKKFANGIAKALRESSGGRLPSVKATGWVIEAYGCAQVSMNLTDLSQTALHTAFDAGLEEAEKLGVRVTGSELVGLVPKAALVDAGRHFLRKMKKPDFAPESELVNVAVRTLGLSELSPFEPQKKVIEYTIAEPRPLIEKTVSGFLDTLSSDAPAPGGGFGGGLGWCTRRRPGGDGRVDQRAEERQARRHRRARRSPERRALCRGRRRHARLRRRARGDALCRKRPKRKSKSASKRWRPRTKKATLVPLGALRLAAEACELAAKAAKDAYEPSLSDAGAGAALALAAGVSARYNVLINLKDQPDAAFAKTTRAEADALIARAQKAASEASTILETALALSPR